MAPKCKICGLPEGLKRAIERDMKMGLGVTNIVKKYPQAKLNAGNVYTHKKHLTLSEAQEVYDHSLQEKVEKEGKIEKVEILESPDKLMMDPPDMSDMSLTEQMATNLTERGTTGNRIIDDVLMLDTIIQQGPMILDQVTPSHVMEAIKIKHNLLDGANNLEQSERKIEIHMGMLLQQISKEEPTIIISE